MPLGTHLSTACRLRPNHCLRRPPSTSPGALLGDRFFFVELPPVAFSQIKPVHGAIEALPCAGLIAVSAGHVAQQAGYTPECLMATDGLSSVTPSAATSSGVTPGAGTAETTAADFTCRYFAPKLGIDEDDGQPWGGAVQTEGGAAGGHATPMGRPKAI